MVKKYLKNVLKYAGIFAVVMGICMLLLYLVCLIPQSRIKENVEDSIGTVMKNGNRKIFTVLNKQVAFDTYADAMMLNTAYCIDSTHPFYSMLFARSNYVDGVTDTTISDKAYENNVMPYFASVEDLGKTVSGEKMVAIEYARYWHGYLIVLRPLLIFFNYDEIQIISYVFHITLLLILMYHIKKKIGTKYIIPFIFGFVAVEGYLVYCCFEETIAFSLILIESIVLFYIKEKDYVKYFFVIGIITPFFDLLTIPFAIAIIPLVIYYLLNKENSAKDFLLKTINFGVLFAIGYIAMWIMKWLLVDVLYGRDLIKNAIGQVMYRADGPNIKLLDATVANIKRLGYPVTISACMIIASNIIIAIFEKIKNKKIPEPIKCNFVLAIAAFIPIMWYMIVKEHSLSHAYFTYRNLLILCVASQVMVINIIDLYIKDKINKKYALVIFSMIDLIFVVLNLVVG